MTNESKLKAALDKFFETNFLFTARDYRSLLIDLEKNRCSRAVSSISKKNKRK